MSRSTAVVEHPPTTSRVAAADVADSREVAAARLGLSALDVLAATALTGTDAREVTDLTRAAAAALADPNVDAARAARNRMIARQLAIERTTLSVLLGLLGEHVRTRADDRRGLRVIRLLDGLANSSCKRLTMLLGAAEQRTAPIAIGNAIIVEAAQ